MESADTGDLKSPPRGCGFEPRPGHRAPAPRPGAPAPRPGAPSPRATLVEPTAPPTTPRAVLTLLLAPLLAACQGRAEPALELLAGLGEGLAFAAMLVGLTALAFVLTLWILFALTCRRGSPSLGLALVLAALHVAAALAAALDGDPITPWLVAATALPGLALGVALRRAAWVRLVLALALPALVALALLLRPRPLEALPAQPVEAASAFGHACVRLADGRVACVGDDATSSRRPYLVRGIDDALALAAAYDLTCARRQRAPVTCWGQTLRPTPGERTALWPVPDSTDTAALALGRAQLVLLAADGALRGFPGPLPEGLHHARLLAAHPDDEGSFAALDAAGALWLWRHDGPALESVLRVPDVGDAAALAVADEDQACVLRPAGAVECFAAPERPGEPIRRRLLPDLHADHLVALDDPFDTFCARRSADGVVLCWAGDEDPRTPADLPVATALQSTASALCDARPAGLRCAPSSSTRGLEDTLAVLLALPVAE